MSLLCASLTWLADERDRARKGKLNAATDDGVNGNVSLSLRRTSELKFHCLAKEWVIEQARERVRRELEADEREYEERLAQARKREVLMKKMAKARVVKKTVGTLLLSGVMSDVCSFDSDRNLKSTWWIALEMMTSSCQKWFWMMRKI